VIEVWGIIGWIVWVALAFFAFSLAFGCRTCAKAKEGFSWATAVQAFFFCVSAILFLIFGWNKLHILWVAPVAFFTAQFLVLSRIPILSSLVLFATGAFLKIILIGVGEIPSPGDDPPLN